MPKSWAEVRGDYVSVYDRCHFEAGTYRYSLNGCGVFDRETLAELKRR